MSVNILRKDIRFRNNILNSPFFKGSAFSSMVGNAGMQYYIEQDVSIDWSSVVMTKSEGWLQNNNTNSNIFKRFDGGDFLSDGFSVGDDVVFFSVYQLKIVVDVPITGEVTTYSDYSLYREVKINSVTTDTIVFNQNIDNVQATIDSLTNGITTVTLDEVWGTQLIGSQDIGGFELNYSFVQNNANFTGLSLIDDNSNKYYASIVNGAGLETTTDFFNNSIKSNRSKRDAVTITRGANTLKEFTIREFTISFNIIQNFIIYQVVELPDYIEAYYDNITNGTSPEDYAAAQCLKYTCELSFFSSYQYPSTKKSLIFETEQSNTGWENETYNGGQSNFQISNVSFLDNNGDSINSIDIGGCTFSFNVKSLKNRFPTLDNFRKLFCIKHTALKNASDYENNADYYSSNVLNDIAYVSYGTTNAGSDLIKNLESVAVDDFNTTITGEIDFASFTSLYPDKIPNEGDVYRFGVYTGSTNIELGVDSASTNVGVIAANNEVCYLDVSVNTYLKNTDIPNLWLHDRFEIFDHPTDTDQEGYTGLKGWIEDGIVLFAKKSLKKGAYINSVKLATVAEKQTDKTYFIIDEYNVDLSSQVKNGGYTNININQNAGYNLNDDSQFNKLIINNEVSTGDYALINFYIPYKLPWQSWQRLEGVDTVFYDSNAQNEYGFNRNSSRYSSENGYEVKLYLIADIEQDGIVTEYIDRSPIADVSNYDEPVAFTNEIITESESAVDLGGAIQTDATTIIKAKFNKVAHGLLVNELYGVIRLEVQRALGDGIYEISTIREGYDLSPLKPITGSYATIEVLDADNIQVSCKTDFNLLGNESYRISAKLGAKVSAPLTGDYNQDYNNDYDNL